MMGVEATASALTERRLHEIARGRHPWAVVVTTPAVVRIGVQIGANIPTSDRAGGTEDPRFALAGFEIQRFAQTAIDAETGRHTFAIVIEKLSLGARRHARRPC